MHKVTSSLAAETGAIREIYAGINRNDIEAAVGPLAAEIMWIEPVEYTGGTTCRGREAVAAHLARARGTWAEGSCEVERIVVAADKIVVYIRVHVRLKTETEWREGTHAAVYTFRDGKATEMRIFDDTRQALEWAGVEDAS
jgi:ketosteroid isomerase-like protein